MTFKNLFHPDKVYLLDVLHGLTNLPPQYANVIIFDPPYNIGKDFGNNFDNLDFTDYLEWADKWIKQGIRVLNDSGTMYIYGFSEILAHIFVRINLPKRWLVWHYTNKNSPKNFFWQRSHESIIAVWKDTDKRIFNLDAVREPYTDVFLKNAAGKKRAATPGRFSHGNKKTIYTAHENGALPRDVIKVSALAGGAGRVERFFYCDTCENIFMLENKGDHKEHKIIEHPTQKPTELTKKLLLASKPSEGGKVVVPFAGTGSELYIAKKLGMEAIGFEINEDYYCMSNLLIQKGFPNGKI